MTVESSPAASKILSKWPVASSLLACTFGAVVLASWALHIRALRTFIPGQVGAKPNTGACFLLLGAALWLATRGSRRTWFLKWWRFALAATVAAVGLLSFMEYRFDWDPGIDQILFKAGTEDLPGSVRAGLMSPLAAACFCLLGCAVLLAGSRKRCIQILIQSLACCSAVISMFGLLDFVLQANTTHTHISPLTALVLFLLSFGVVFMRTEHGISALISSTQSGGRLLRRLLPASIAIPTVIAWLRWHGEMAGLLPAWMGVALTTVASVVLLALVTVWAAAATNRAESTKMKAFESLQRLAAVVNSSGDAIVGQTLDGVVSSWNKGAETIYGYCAEEIIGRSVTVLIPADRVEESEQSLNQVRRGQEVEPRETVRICKDGTRIDVSIAISPLTDEHGVVVGASTIGRDITERKRMEQALAASEQRYRSLVTASAQIVWTTDAQGQVENDIPTWRAFTGMQQNEIMGAGWLDSLHPDDRARTREVWTAAWQNRICYDTEYRIRRHDGVYRTFAVRGVPVGEADGTIREWVGACTDITERKQAEQQLQESAAYARNLIEASLDPLVTISREGKITDANQATENATGLPRETLIGSDFSNYFTEPDKARAGYERVFSEGLVQDYPLSLRHVSGKRMNVLYNAAVYRNRKGEVDGVFAAARDVTEVKRAEELLRQESNFRRNVIEHAAEGLCVCHMVNDFPYVQFTVWNERMREITGYSLDEINRLGWYQTLFPDSEHQDRARQRMFRRGQDNSLHGEDWEIRRADGETRILQITTSLLETRGETRHTLALMQDITLLKKAEREVLLSQQRLALALKAGHAGTFDWDMQNNLNLWTPEAEQVHGLAPGEFGGKYEDWERLVVPEDLPAAKQGIESALKSGEFAGEWRIRRRNDGEIRWIIARAKVLSDDAGKPWRMIGVNVDVTERKQAEEEVRKLNAELEQRVMQRTAQLEAANKELEAFTYSVSHDLRAPLRHISGFSKILAEEFGSSLPPDAQRHLKRIDEGTIRMGQLVDDLLNLGRVGRKQLSVQAAGLRSIVDEVIANLKSDMGDRQVDWKIGDLPYVECDTALIQQVFQNLLSNALKFTRPRRQAVIEIGQTQKDGNGVVYIRDNGVGFSMKYADKLFGVFQRLHRAEDFEGTGVGLATVQRIIQKHGGRIWAEGELDKGAAFYFTLGAVGTNDAESRVAYAGAKD